MKICCARQREGARGWGEVDERRAGEVAVELRKSSRVKRERKFCRQGCTEGGWSFQIMGRKKQKRKGFGTRKLTRVVYGV